MSVLQTIREALKNAPGDVDMNLKGALADAERLADEFSQVRPKTYIVPIEKFVGLPVVGEANLQVGVRLQR